MNNNTNKYNKLFIRKDTYIDKALIVLGAITSGVSIISFTSVAGAPVGTASASFTLIFHLTTEIINILLNIARNKKKKHDKILVLAKSKFSSIEALVSQALIDLEISHQEFVSIFKEKDKYKKMKKKVKSLSEKQENMRLNSVNSKT